MYLIQLRSHLGKLTNWIVLQMKPDLSYQNVWKIYPTNGGFPIGKASTNGECSIMLQVFSTKRWIQFVCKSWIQWLFQESKMEVPSICKNYVVENPHKLWPYMVQYLHFRILKLPLIQLECFAESGSGQSWKNIVIEEPPTQIISWECSIDILRAAFRLLFLPLTVLQQTYLITLHLLSGRDK